jgi:hypothetical protein
MTGSTDEWDAPFLAGAETEIFIGSIISMRNVFEAILECGHDEDFNPTESAEFRQTDAPAGSRAKIDTLSERVMRGLPLWHPEDRTDYSGLTGSVRPRA